MKFYFCERYINADANDKEVEWDMYAAISYFWSFNDHYGYENWKNHHENFFSYFSLTFKEKCSCWLEIGGGKTIIDYVDVGLS